MSSAAEGSGLTALGSVSERIAHQATCSVLVVRGAHVATAVSARVRHRHRRRRPAGLSAAVYAASDGLDDPGERDVPGGQASHTSSIENVFGIPEGVGGAELARMAGRQAERFGAELTLLRGASGNRKPDGRFVIEVEGGYEISAPVAVASTGMDWRRLAVEGLDELLGRGVYYGAGRSEAAQCGGDVAIVVGAGNSAGQAVLHLARAGVRV
jgi:thioredoxin reductase (NADPH)